MTLWEILVLALLKQGIRCDCDRPAHMANHHAQVRQVSECGSLLPDKHCHRRAINRNVALITPDLLPELNRLAVAEGHALAGWKEVDSLSARCDSLVAETNVQVPTDINLLRDSMRCLIRAVDTAGKQLCLAGWRQAGHLQRKVRGLLHIARAARRRQSDPEAVTEYLHELLELARRPEASLEELTEAGIPETDARGIKGFLGHAQRQADQACRRLLAGEKIPHEEKVMSIFELHTRSCQKGKAGIKAALGLPVTIVESEHQFVLNAKVLWIELDVDVAAQVIGKTQEWYPELAQCSFDKGYHRPTSQQALGALLELNALPRNGRLSKAARQDEEAAEFRAAR